MSLLANRIADSKKRKRVSHSRHLCPHCKQSLTLKTFKRHQKLYCKGDGTWTVDSESDDDAVFMESKCKCIVYALLFFQLMQVVLSLLWNLQLYQLSRQNLKWMRR